MLAKLVSISWPHDPPTSASQSAGITGMSHCTQLVIISSGLKRTMYLPHNLSICSFSEDVKNAYYVPPIMGNMKTAVLTFIFLEVRVLLCCLGVCNSSWLTVLSFKKHMTSEYTGITIHTHKYTLCVFMQWSNHNSLQPLPSRHKGSSHFSLPSGWAHIKAWAATLC